MGVYLLTILHRVFYLRYGTHCRRERLVHISCRIARSIASIFALVDGADELRYRLFVNIMFVETLRDIVARELADGDVKLVADISPEGAEHLVVELAVVVLAHQFVGLAETFCCHLVSLLGAQLHDVGILDSTFAEHYQQHYERCDEETQDEPVVGAVEEHSLGAGNLHLAGLYRMNIFVLGGSVVS